MKELALAAVTDALQRSPESIPILALAAAVQERNGQLEGAARARRELARLDVRSRSSHLQRLASLRLRLGQNAEGLQAAEELMRVSGGLPANVLFFADTCYRVGKVDEGLQAMRRAIRANPRDKMLQQKFAESLRLHFRTEEAIEIFWRLYEKAEDLDDRLRFVQDLARLHERLGTSEGLLARLGRVRSADPKEARIRALCLANAHAALEQPGAMIDVLEAAIAERPDDLKLLTTLVDFGEWHVPSSDLIRYQRKVVRRSCNSASELGVT